MGDRCTGHCCREFTLTHSQENLNRAYAAWMRRETSWKKRGGRILRSIPADIHLIAPMVRPLNKKLKGNPLYTCVHIQDNGDCGIYKMRPKMCRDYPYGKVCDHKKKGCTWDDALDEKKLAKVSELVQLGAK